MTKNEYQLQNQKVSHLFYFILFYFIFNLKIKLDKKIGNEDENEPPPLPQPFQCSITFQLQRFVTQQQII